MKIKLDENLPVCLADSLQHMGYDVHTVFDERIAGCNDQILWDECQKEERLLITQDLDFSDLRKFVPGSHFGIILVRLKNPSRTELTVKVIEMFDNLATFLKEGCFIVLTDNKIRISQIKRGSDDRGNGQ